MGAGPQHKSTRLPPPWGRSHPRPRPADARWAAAAAAAGADTAALAARAGPVGWRTGRPCASGPRQGLRQRPQPRRRPHPARRARAPMARCTVAPAQTRPPGGTLTQILAAAHTLGQTLTAAPGGCWRARLAAAPQMPVRQKERAQRCVVRSGRPGRGWHRSPTPARTLRYPALAPAPGRGSR